LRDTGSVTYHRSSSLTNEHGSQSFQLWSGPSIGAKLIMALHWCEEPGSYFVLVERSSPLLEDLHQSWHPGAVALLMFVPLVNILMLLVLAFSEWPVLRECKLCVTALENLSDQTSRREWASEADGLNLLYANLPELH